MINFASNLKDSEEHQFQKNLVFAIAISCLFLGILWSYMYYKVFGAGLIAMLPLSFVAIVGISLIYSSFSKTVIPTIFAFLTCILWVPALCQWSIGSSHNAGLVIMWSFLSPIGAILFLNKKQSVFWMGQFLLLICISFLFEPKLLGVTSQIEESARTMFYMMNVVLSSVMVFMTSLYFLNGQIKQRSKIKELLKIAEEKTKEITDSITYAKRIQNALLPPQQLILNSLPNSFLLYKPKDILAGDFYWLEKIKDKVYFAAADCTGHGVPGALISVICNNTLNRSVREFNLTEPGIILDKARDLVIEEFEQSEEDVKDGMDIALCTLEGMNLKYAGANNPLWIIRNNEVIETKADKQPIGKFDQPAPFTTHLIQLEKDDCCYIFSDGFVDQFGGATGKKYNPKGLRNLLLSVQDKSMNQQKEIVDNAFEEWRGEHEQIDDVCILGFKV